MLRAAPRELVPGPIGPIELALDLPADGKDGAAVRGIAFIGHPHPLYGGTLENKVAATLALLVIVAGAYRDLHWLALLAGMFVALKANLFVILIKA